MKTSLDHLPAAKQRELLHVRSVLMNEFEAAVAGGTQSWRHGAKIQKVIVFGSFSRDDWVDEPENGYQSDWDLLIIVNNEHLTDIADYWYVAEDKLLRDPEVHRTVNIIVHTLAQVNEALSKGEYFWIDIIRDGVMLFELPGHPLATPKNRTAAEVHASAQHYFEAKFEDIGDWLRLAEVALCEDASNLRWRKKAAFNLHQAAETAYACFLLVQTSYFPRSHNIKFLRSMAEAKDKRLVEAWPRQEKLDRRRFELLKRAYVESRYSDAYEISRQDVVALAEHVAQLRALVDTLCRERLTELKALIG